MMENQGGAFYTRSRETKALCTKDYCDVVAKAPYIHEDVFTLRRKVLVIHKARS